MVDLIINNAIIINEGKQIKGSVSISDGKITEIIENSSAKKASETIDASGLVLIPGVIDDQVHFREPGLTSKADIWHESRAAAAGGITSYMEMPNTLPQTVTQEALAEKFRIAGEKSLVNYSFYIGATNTNLEEVLKTDPLKVCGVKLFMGSSTGNMLVDNREALEALFSKVSLPVAVHCEDEGIIRANIQKYRFIYGDDIPVKYHPVIRSEEACYKSTSLAIEMAKKYDVQLHVLHLSTGKELDLFTRGTDYSSKKITNEVCVHHLWFSDKDYEKYGMNIKWNPAIKTESDRQALFDGVINGSVDVIATDHAPHTIEEKSGNYFKAPSGGPLVQHSLTAMLEFYKAGNISLEKIVEKMCHSPAEIFKVRKRGYIRPGYWADLVLVDLNQPWIVHRDNILSKCGWSPFEGTRFSTKVYATLVNGEIVYLNERIIEKNKALSLEFNRNL